MGCSYFFLNKGTGVVPKYIADDFEAYALSEIYFGGTFFSPVTHYYTDFESLSTGTLSTGLSPLTCNHITGNLFSGLKIDKTYLVYDDFESYSLSDEVSGLSGGGGYIVSGTLYPATITYNG